MKVILQSVPKSRIRNNQCGDWRLYNSRTIKATTAFMGDEDSEFAVALHEAIEAWLCRKHGVTDESVTAFDAMFEEERERSLHGPHDEDGEDLRSPYRIEHEVATKIERILIEACGVTWSQHEDTVHKLFE